MQQLSKEQVHSSCVPRGLEGEPLATVFGYIGKEEFREQVKQLVSLDNEQRGTHSKKEDSTAGINNTGIMRKVEDKVEDSAAIEDAEVKERAVGVQQVNSEKRALEIQQVGNADCGRDGAVVAGNIGLARADLSEGGVEMGMHVEWQQEQQYKPSSVWNNYIHHNFVLDRNALVSSFTDDCARDKTQNAFIPQHCDNKSIARVATYNVHKWTGLDNQDSYNAIAIRL